MIRKNNKFNFWDPNENKKEYRKIVEQIKERKRIWKSGFSLN